MAQCVGVSDGVKGDPVGGRSSTPPGSKLLGMVLVILMTVLGVAADAQTPAGRSAATFTPEDLLGVLDWQSLQAQFADSAQWWPALPLFNVGIGDRAPGLRFVVIQPFARVFPSGTLGPRTDTTVLLYENPSAATADFAGRLLSVNDKGAALVDGPEVGDRTRYFTRASAQYTEPAPLPHEGTIRFQMGPFISRVSVFRPWGQRPEAPEALARYAGVILERIRYLGAGMLKTPVLPQRSAVLLPPAAAAAAIGPVLGSAIVPPQAWALMDNSGKPLETLNTLRRGGVAEMALRRYGLATDRSHVVEVIGFVFAHAQAAYAWQRGFVASARDSALDPGRTGPAAAFTRHASGAYELQFAKDRVVADVFCEAPFGKTSSVCEAPVRALAEAWYGALPERR